MGDLLCWKMHARNRVHITTALHSVATQPWKSTKLQALNLAWAWQSKASLQARRNSKQCTRSTQRWICQLWPRSGACRWVSPARTETESQKGMLMVNDNICRYEKDNFRWPLWVIEAPKGWCDTSMHQPLWVCNHTECSSIQYMTQMIDRVLAACGRASLVRQDAKHPLWYRLQVGWVACIDQFDSVNIWTRDTFEWSTGMHLDLLVNGSSCSPGNSTNNTIIAIYCKWTVWSLCKILRLIWVRAWVLGCLSCSWLCWSHFQQPDAALLNLRRSSAWFYYDRCVAQPERLKADQGAFHLRWWPVSVKPQAFAKFWMFFWLIEKHTCLLWNPWHIEAG